MNHKNSFQTKYTGRLHFLTWLLQLLFYLFLLYCHYCSVMYCTVMPVSAYMALAFVFGFIQIKLMMMI